MPGVHCKDVPGCGLVIAEPDRHKHGVVLIFQHIPVGSAQNLGRRKAGPGIVFDHILRHHHEECCRDSLAGHIRNHQCQMRLVQREEIIEIASHLLCRHHGGREQIVLALREAALQHGMLDAAGKLQLGLNPLLFLRQVNVLPGVTVNLRHHLGEIVREQAKFVSLPDAAELSHHLVCVSRPDIMGDAVLNLFYRRNGPAVEKQQYQHQCQHHPGNTHRECLPENNCHFAPQPFPAVGGTHHRTDFTIQYHRFVAHIVIAALIGEVFHPLEGDSGGGVFQQFLKPGMV